MFWTWRGYFSDKEVGNGEMAKELQVRRRLGIVSHGEPEPVSVERVAHTNTSMSSHADSYVRTAFSPNHTGLPSTRHVGIGMYFVYLVDLNHTLVGVLCHAAVFVNGLAFHDPFRDLVCRNATLTLMSQRQQDQTRDGTRDCTTGKRESNKL